MGGGGGSGEGRIFSFLFGEIDKVRSSVRLNDVHVKYTCHVRCCFGVILRLCREFFQKGI